MASRLTVKVIPGASKDQVVGLLGEVLKIRVQAPPEKGKANKAVVSLLATYLEVPARSINICSGHTSQSKVVEVQGLSDADLRGKLARFGA